MIGIEAIGVHLPDRRIDNRERVDEFGIDENFLEHKTGMLRLARKEEAQDTSDLCCLAFEALCRKKAVALEDIDCIVVCTQNPDGAGLPHTSAIVHGKLELSDHCAAFDISLGCSGYVYGLSVVQSFMQANDLQKGILFTADPYSKVIDPNDKDTSLLFGDAATATLLGANPVWHLGKFLFGTRGAEFDAIRVDSDDGLLKMNGRGVYTFSATTMPPNIVQVLENNGVELKDVDRFVLHQGSRFIVDTLRKRLGVDEDKVPFESADYGNTVSSSIPIILEDMTDCRVIVIAGFGVGLSWGSTVLLNSSLEK